jgi:hypothetical protein
MGLPDQLTTCRRLAVWLLPKLRAGETEINVESYRSWQNEQRFVLVMQFVEQKQYGVQS